MTHSEARKTAADVWAAVHEVLTDAQSPGRELGDVVLYSTVRSLNQPQFSTPALIVLQRRYDIADAWAQTGHMNLEVEFAVAVAGHDPKADAASAADIAWSLVDMFIGADIRLGDRVHDTQLVTLVEDSEPPGEEFETYTWARLTLRWTFNVLLGC